VDWAAWWIAHDEAVITLIIGAVIGAFVNWFFFRRAEKPKRLSWEVMSHNPIISADAQERGRLKVLYDGDPVDEPNIIVVRLGNTGKREILGTDFPEPIRLDFRGANVLTVQGVRCSNPGIAAQCIEDPTEPPSVVLLRPELLNSGEWLDMKFVTDGELKKPKIDVRFAGQSDQAADLRRRRHRVGRITGGLLLLAFLGLQVYFFVFVAPKVPNFTDVGPWQGWVAFGATAILLILMAAVRHWSSQLGWRPIKGGTADEDDDFDDEDETE
jgi:hypothetical protein